MAYISRTILNNTHWQKLLYNVIGWEKHPILKLLKGKKCPVSKSKVVTK